MAFYQTIQEPLGSALPQEPILALDEQSFLATDDAPNTRTVVTLADPMSRTRLGGAAFPSGTLCKFDGVSEYIPTLAGDSALLVEGVALTACAGAGQPFELVELRGQVVTFLKDGNALNVGDPIKPSTTTNGAGGPAGSTDDVCLLNRKAALAGAATSEGRF